MSTGNLGNMPLIIIPAVCKESGSPFGAVSVCNTKGMSYASMSMAVRQSNLPHLYNLVGSSYTKHNSFDLRFSFLYFWFSRYQTSTFGLLCTKLSAYIRAGILMRTRLMVPQ